MKLFEESAKNKKGALSMTDSLFFWYILHPLCKVASLVGSEKMVLLF